jgi:acyl carrier protein
MTTDLPDVQQRVEHFIRKQFMIQNGDSRFDRTVDLYENGYVDSIGVVELLAFIQEEFGVEIPEELLLSKEFTFVEGIGRIIVELR